MHLIYNLIINLPKFFLTLFQLYFNFSSTLTKLEIPIFTKIELKLKFHVSVYGLRGTQNHTLYNTSGWIATASEPKTLRFVQSPSFVVSIAELRAHRDT